MVLFYTKKGIPAALLREMEPRSEIKKTTTTELEKQTFCRNWFGYVSKGKTGALAGDSPGVLEVEPAGALCAVLIISSVTGGLGSAIREMQWLAEQDWCCPADLG